MLNDEPEPRNARWRHSDDDEGLKLKSNSATSFRGFVFPVASFAVADGEAKAEEHDADRARQHYQTRVVNRTLGLLRRCLGIGVAHGTALGKRRSAAQPKNGR